MTSTESPPATSVPLRYTLLTAGLQLEAWQVEALARLPPTVARPVRVLSVDDGRLRDSRRVSDGKWIEVAYRRWRLTRPGRARAPRHLPDALDLLPLSQIAGADDVFRVVNQDEALHQIEDVRSDFVIDLTGSKSAIVCGSAVPEGVWRFTPPESPPTERPGKRNIGLIVVRLVRQHSAEPTDTVLREAWFRAAEHSLAATVDRVLFGGAELLRSACAELAILRRLPTDPRPPPTEDPTIASLPTIARTGRGKLSRMAAALVRQERWHVGIIDAPIAEVFTSGRPEGIEWLRSSSSRRYVADPFGIPEDDRILVEAYDALAQRGYIATLDSRALDTATASDAVLDTGGHMSYPYLLAIGDEVYCIPETCDQRRILLLRALDYPDQWEEAAVLVSNFAGADSTVVRYADRWWMFSVDNDMGPETHLHVFHAPRLDGPWSPHLLNPVKIDVRSSRPAGTPFMVSGDLIRPAQDGSTGYGAGVVFNRVRVLTPTEFDEVPVSRLGPASAGPYRHGLHTVSSWGDRTLVDGKMRRSSLASVAGHVWARVRQRRTNNATPSAQT